MNWNYVAPRVVLLSLMWAFFTFGLDPLLRRGLITASQSATGARTEVGRVVTLLTAPSISLETVRIGDRSKPASNLAEWTEARLQLAWKPLLQGRFVVEDATISGLKFETPRADSGGVPDWKPVWKRRGAELLPDWPFKLPAHLDDRAKDLSRSAFDEFVLRARTAADPQQLECYRVARNLEERWPARFDELAARARGIEDRIRKWENTLKSSPSPSPETLEQAVQAYQDLQQVLAEAQQIRAELQTLPEAARKDFEQLTEAKDRDLTNLQKKIEVVRLDGDGLTSLLLGDELKRKLEAVSQVVAALRRMLADAPAEIEPVRSRGRTIEFAGGAPEPKWLLSRLQVSGEASLDGHALEFSGTLCDVASHPERWGKPVTLRLTGRGDSSLEIVGTFDRTSAEPRDELSLIWQIPRPSPLTLGRPGSLVVEVTAENTEWHARLRRGSGRIEGTIHLRQSPARLTASFGDRSSPAETTPLIQKASAEGHRRNVAALGAVVSQSAAGFGSSGSDLMSQALARSLISIQELEATVSFVAEAGEPLQFQLKSNLGPQLATGLKTDLIESLNQRREEALAALDERIGERSAALREMMGRRYNDVLESVDLREADATALVSQLSRGKVNVEALKPVQNLVNGRAGENLKKVASGELPAKPRDLDGVRKEVRDIRNDLKSLRNARQIIRK